MSVIGFVRAYGGFEGRAALIQIAGDKIKGAARAVEAMELLLLSAEARQVGWPERFLSERTFRFNALVKRVLEPTLHIITAETGSREQHQKSLEAFRQRNPMPVQQPPSALREEIRKRLADTSEGKLRFWKGDAWFEEQLRLLRAPDEDLLEIAKRLFEYDWDWWSGTETFEHACESWGRIAVGQYFGMELPPHLIEWFYKANVPPCAKPAREAHELPVHTCHGCLAPMTWIWYGEIQSPSDWSHRFGGWLPVCPLCKINGIYKDSFGYI